MKRAKDSDIREIIDRANHVYNLERWTEAFKLYKLAERLDPECGHTLFRFGVMYRKGFCVKKDTTLANSYFDRAIVKLKIDAEHGDGEALCDLGYCCDMGYGLPEDNEKAVTYYKASAETGYPRGQSNLGYMYNNGEGVPTDEAKALEYFKKAADAGFPLAQSNIAEMYDGEGTTRNPKLALKYYQMAADQGYPPALCSLADIYYRGGSGVTKDTAKAMEYYRQSAEYGNSDAQYTLGKILWRAKKDYYSGFQYFFRASITDNHKKSRIQKYMEVSQVNNEHYKPSVLGLANILAENWPESHNMVHEKCKPAIFEFSSIFRDCEKRIMHIPSELISLIVKSVVRVWPESHWEQVQKSLLLHKDGSN